jgi:hypothetical protein
MLRRLAALALAASLALLSTSASTADARTFARPPEGAQLPLAIEPAPDHGPTLAPAMRARVKRVLAARRAKNIAAFRAYASRGSYPHNIVTSGPLNVWIDEEGRMCAAATMIFTSGARSLVRQIGRDDNYIRLGDVTSGPALDWILTSGLTQLEVATIQEPFMGIREPMPRPEPIMVQPAPSRRELEDQRLAARYREVLAMLGSWQADSLDAAVDRLASRPDLVAQLVR